MPVGKAHLKYLDDAVNSVINQTYPYWKLWIFFDIKEFSDDFTIYESDNIRCLWDGEHKKQTIRRNQIIEKIKDKYTCFLDADDLFLPNRLKLNAGKDFIWSYGDCYYFDSEKEWYFKPRQHIKQEDLINSCCGIPIGSVTFRTDYLKELMFDEKLVIGEDWNLYYRAFKKQPLYIPELHYRKRVGTSTCRHFPHSLYRWRLRRYMRKVAHEQTASI